MPELQLNPESYGAASNMPVFLTSGFLLNFFFARLDDTEEE